MAGCALGYRNGGGIVRALSGVDLRVPAGSFLAVVGASGCGKTTLLKAVAGLAACDSGTIAFGGAPGAPARRPRIGYMFQDARLLPWLTVRENLALAFPGDGVDQEAIEACLAGLGLGAWIDARPKRLSGGMAQRAALARALCRRPELLLLDEPFGALDALTRTRLQAELAVLREASGFTVILVTHDIEEAVFLADRVAVMESGAVKADFSVPLPRARDRRGAPFQALCRSVEAELGLG